MVSDEELRIAAITFPYNTPETHEGYLIRKYFDSFFPHPCAIRTVPGGRTIACSSAIALKWDEEFAKNADDSGRSIKDIHPPD
jgi:asparagine synthase (glutamine-hydrolysing)